MKTTSAHSQNHWAVFSPSIINWQKDVSHLDQAIVNHTPYMVNAGQLLILTSHQKCQAISIQFFLLPFQATYIFHFLNASSLSLSLSLKREGPTRSDHLLQMKLTMTWDDIYHIWSAWYASSKLIISSKWLRWSNHTSDKIQNSRSALPPTRCCVCQAGEGKPSHFDGTSMSGNCTTHCLRCIIH